MNIDLLVKCFIAFCIGAIVYKFISDRYLTNIIEGQCMIANRGGDCIRNTTEPTPGNPDTTVMDTIPIENVKEFINNINDDIFKSSIRDNIDKVRLALVPTNKPVPEIPPSINLISTFEQFGEIPEALDYLELIVMNIADLDTRNFKLFIESIMNSAEYCSTNEDLNTYMISIILLQYYNIKIASEQKYINISNKLSKYLPDILENIQQLNINCNNPIKTEKSSIMDTMIYRLFKNNNTVINIGSLDSLVNELNKLDRVYGVVILLCITYIVVKFLGMFNMKMEV